jgi:outer membrane protein
MKNTIKFLSALAICAATVSCNQQKTAETVTKQADSTVYVAAQGAIVYVDLDVILARYDMANELSSVVETKVQNIQAEITRRGQKLEKAAKDFQEKMEKGLMTRSTAEAQAQKLQEQETEFNTYAAQKQQEIQEEQMVMMNQIGDAIKTYIEKYNAEKQYAMILTSQGGAPVITADPSLNITEDVIAGLNAEYIANKNKKNNE